MTPNPNLNLDHLEGEQVILAEEIEDYLFVVTVQGYWVDGFRVTAERYAQCLATIKAHRLLDAVLELNTIAHYIEQAADRDK